MITYAFDIEVFKNLFTATFVDVENEGTVHTFCIGLGQDDLENLKEFMNQEMIVVGYNNHSYDDPVLRYIINYEGGNLLSDVYSLSSKLMDDNYRRDKELLELRYPRNTMYPWNSIDLMSILAFDKLGISLKQTAINLKWGKIQDIPIDPTAPVKQKELELVIDYNLNDVLITKRLYEEITPIRELRFDLSRLYSVDLTSASDSKMANMILENIYSNELKVDIRRIRKMRTNREKVLLGNCLANFVQFQSVELNELLKRIASRYVYVHNYYRYSDKVSFANCNFSLGIGGLHTEDPPGAFYSDDEYLIQDMDVASYYPNLIINNKFYPRHLGEDFIEVLKTITGERLQAKKDGDKVKADGLKITVNSIFGKMGSQYFWLYDPKQFLSTTISGQMGLLMLVEGMYMNGIEVLSCNTDGVVCRIPRDKLDKYYEIAKAWEDVTDLVLEFTPYKKYIRRDVNSYITVKEDGHTKEKGAFLKEVDLKKAYHMPIVAKALHAYFVDDVPVKETIENCKDVLEFCISQKTGNNFYLELHKTNSIERLQKTNRFFITTDTEKGGALLKQDKYSDRKTGLYVGNLAYVLNDYDPNIPFEDYHVDLWFYEKEVMKIIDEIEPKQMTLFELSPMESGKYTKQEVDLKPIVQETKNTIGELKKLGKLQLLVRLENIVAHSEKIEGISPRYVYVEDFDVGTMTADVYCLAKSVRQPIKIGKTAYRKYKLEQGQLVFCTKFEKQKNEHVLIDYKITDKIEPVSQNLI